MEKRKNTRGVYVKTQVLSRIGEIKVNNNGSLMKIIEYVDYSNTTVQFKNGYTTKATYGEFKNGSIKSPYDRTIYSIGYFGEGDYVMCMNGKETLIAKTWRHMLERCYNEKSQNRTSYI